ncbi:hypothetical protein ACN47E_002521 [Coniothyrium glycines]
MHPAKRTTNSTTSSLPSPGPEQKDNLNPARRKAKWLSPFPLRTSLILLTLPLALSPVVILAAAAEIASQSYILGRSCYPNGSWKEASGATWRIMDSSYFFTPNLSFGSFTFTQVKVIDIAWDLLVGRGVQILLAVVNYRVFGAWVVWHMERWRTRYKMYAAVAFDATSLATLGVLGKECLARGEKSWRGAFRWLGVLGMVLSTLYVLSFPTLMAAMTGYITTFELYVENLEGNLIEWGQVRQVEFVVQDASRIGYQGRLVITAEDESFVEAVYAYRLQFNESNRGIHWYNTSSSLSPGIGEFSNINQSSSWFNPGGGLANDIDAPSLNITVYETNDDGPQIPPMESRHKYAFAFSIRSNTTYNTTYLLEHGSCKPSETYQWGFSYIFLFMVSIFNFIWTCIMVGMWLDTCRGSRMYKHGRRPGLLRSIMDFSAAIRQELGTEAEYLEEEELRQKVTESGGALVVPKTELAVRRVSSGEDDLRRRGWKRSLTRGSTF